eukprot:Rmarinus@m.25926
MAKVLRATIRLGVCARHYHPRVSSSKFFAERKVNIIDAGICDGQPLAGVSYGPSALRSGGMIEKIRKLGWKVNDMGPCDFSKTQIDWDAERSQWEHNALIVGTKNRILCETIKSTPADQFQMVLGGDHSIALGSIAGILSIRPNTGVLWLDAHADINTPESSPSGNIHGMPVSFLMKLIDPSSVPGMEWLEGIPRLDPKRICYVGLRDVDDGEAQIIHDMGIQAYTMEDVDRYGIGRVMDHALNYLSPYRRFPIHMSVDIDAVDPVTAPSTGTAVLGGLTYRESHYCLEQMARSGCLTSMDLVEVNPALSNTEGAKKTIQMGIGLLLTALGKHVL